MSFSHAPQRVWFITGTSKGFGQELVRAALARGDRVVATSREPQKVASLFRAEADRLLVVSLDLNSPVQIATAVESAMQHFGRIDVLVNNAGHGLLGAVEEASDDEIRRVFEVNVFGLLRVTRAVLPVMRRQRSGHLVNLSSIGGLSAWAGWGIYCSTKFAVEGISEALAQEVAHLGIGVTIVEPGLFRTDFLGSSLSIAAQSISDYQDTSGRMRTWSGDSNGHQQGDPARAAEIMVEAVTSEKPPLHLLLGTDAYKRATEKIDSLLAEFAVWRDATLSTDFAATPVHH